MNQFTMVFASWKKKKKLRQSFFSVVLEPRKNIAYQNRGNDDDDNDDNDDNDDDNASPENNVNEQIIGPKKGGATVEPDFPDFVEENMTLPVVNPKVSVLEQSFE
jgi:hypothetical protein